MSIRSPITNKGWLSNRLLLGGATIAMTAIVGTAGMAAAAQPGTVPTSTPAAVARCKAHFKQLGFNNVGQCVKAFEQSLGHGYGNGSGNNVNVTVDTNVKGNNNVVDTVISFIFD